MNKTKISLALFCAAACVPAFAATYWTGANGTEFAVVGDAGNAANAVTAPGDEKLDFGAVGYEYSIGKYEVTNAQYAAFLNAVGSTSVTAGTGTVSLYGGSVITNSGGVFSVSAADANKAVSYVSLSAAAMYCNWLGNGAGADSAYLTGAYDFTNGATEEVFLSVSADAPYRLPTVDEWYKAAYYDPEKNDGTGGYWKYPTRSDSISIDDANFDNGEIRDVGSYADKATAYGTFDQCGNVWEWTAQCDLLADVGPDSDLILVLDIDGCMTRESVERGFRIASLATIPEPSAFGLLAGAFVLALAASRRRGKN